MLPRVKIKILSATGKGLAGQIKAAIQRALVEARPQIATLAIDRLTREADRTLSGRAAAEYKRALQDPESVEITETNITLRLTSPFARALENGFSAFDIKVAMLSKAKKRSKDGTPYADVSFRHAEDQDAASMRGLPADVKNRIAAAVRKKQTALKKQGVDPATAMMTTTRLAGKTPGRERSAHKQGLHDNLARIPKLSGQTITGEYRTFRRISQKSDPAAWWHPGFHGVKLFEKAARDLEPQFKRIIKDSLLAQGFKVK
jgi:hypothetical protein